MRFTKKNLYRFIKRHDWTEKPRKTVDRFLENYTLWKFCLPRKNISTQGLFTQGWRFGNMWRRVQWTPSSKKFIFRLVSHLMKNHHDKL